MTVPLLFWYPYIKYFGMAAVLIAAACGLGAEHRTSNIQHRTPNERASESADLPTPPMPSAGSETAAAQVSLRLGGAVCIPVERGASSVERNGHDEETFYVLRPTPYAPRSLRMLVTAYCPCTRCCGPRAHGVTASGARVTANGGHFVAADKMVLPFGTRVIVPGYAGGAAVPVLDVGGDIKGNRLDVFFPTHRAARAWGNRWLTVRICTLTSNAAASAAPFTKGTSMATRSLGKVARWNERGFGFVDTACGNEVFVHCSVVKGVQGRVALAEGTAVEVEFEKGEKGFKATSCRLV